MRMIAMGRQPKKLEDKSSVLMIRLDNKTLFSLCDEFGIEYNREGLLVEDTTKKALVGEIKNILEKITK